MITYADPNLVGFNPSKHVGIPGSVFYPSLVIWVTDWPFKESPKIFFDYFNSTKSPNATIIQAGPTMIAGILRLQVYSGRLE